MTFKNKLKDLLSIGALNISTSIIFALFWLYLASILSKTEYGELGFLFSVANVGAEISLLGFRSVIVVYESKNQNVFSTSFFLVLISANITAAVTFVLTENFMVSILIVGMVLFQIILSGLNSHQRYADFSTHKIIRAVITVIFAIISYEYFGINGILLSYFISTLFIIKDLNSLLKNKKLEFSLLKPKISFMLHAYSMRLSEIFISWGDKLLIGSLFGFSVLGIYYFAVQYLFLLIALPQSVSIYLVPQESRGKKNKKIKIFSVAISCLIAIVSVMVIPYGINAFLPEYKESIIPMQILSLGIIPLSITSIKDSEFFGQENTRVVLFGSILQSVFYLIFIILLGQEFGLIGISISYVVSVILRTIFYFVIKYLRDN